MLGNAKHDSLLLTSPKFFWFGHRSGLQSSYSPIHFHGIAIEITEAVITGLSNCMHRISAYPDCFSNPGSYCKYLSQEDSVGSENLGGDVGAVGRRGPRSTVVNNG